MTNPPDLHYHSSGSLVTVPKALAPDGQVNLTSLLAPSFQLPTPAPLVNVQVTFLLPDPSIDYIVSSGLPQPGGEGITCAPSVPPASGAALTYDGSKDWGATAVEEVRKLREEVGELRKEVRGLRKKMEVLVEEDEGGQEVVMSTIALLKEELKEVNEKLIKIEKLVEKDCSRNNGKVEEFPIKTKFKTKEPEVENDETFATRVKTVKMKKIVVKNENQDPCIEIKEAVANDEKMVEKNKVILVKTDRNNNKDDNVEDVMVSVAPGNEKFEESVELETMELFNFVSLKPKLIKKIT